LINCARIASTIDYVKSVPAEAVDGSEERDVVLKTPSGDIPFKELAFLTGFALPNFLFHVTTAYAILRHSGVPLGKLDFLGRAQAGQPFHSFVEQDFAPYGEVLPRLRTKQAGGREADGVTQRVLTPPEPVDPAPTFSADDRTISTPCADKTGRSRTWASPHPDL